MRNKTRIFQRMLAVLLAMAAVVGLRFFDNGMLWRKSDGVYTEYYSGYETVYTSAPQFAGRGYARLDETGGEQAAREGLRRLFAEILWEERFDDLLILYAYSPYIAQAEVVLGKEVNLMVAVRGERVSFGTPLLKGSY